MASLIHGYRIRATIFYVSLMDEKGEGQEVTTTDRLTWNQHWKTKDIEFERFLHGDDELKALFNKNFFI